MFIFLSPAIPLAMLIFLVKNYSSYLCPKHVARIVLKSFGLHYFPAPVN